MIPTEKQHSRPIDLVRQYVLHQWPSMLRIRQLGGQFEFFKPEPHFVLENIAKKPRLDMRFVPADQNAYNE